MTILTYGENLKLLIYSKGYTLTSMNNELNRINNSNKSVQNLSKRISSEALKYTEVLQILSILNYKCKWIPDTYDSEAAKSHIRELYKMFNSEIGEDFGINMYDINSIKYDERDMTLIH